MSSSRTRKDAELDLWQADERGYYSGFAPGIPDGNLRGVVTTDDDVVYATAWASGMSLESFHACSSTRSARV